MTHPLRRSFACAMTVVAVVAPPIGWAQPASAAPIGADDPLTQAIAADQAIATGPAELSAGHVDIGPRLDADEWSLMVHDDSVVPSVWRSLDDAVIRVGDAAAQTVPDDPAYAFLGVDPGTAVHVVPQVQASGVVWVGWNTQEPNVLAAIDRGVTLSLLGVQGPGAVAVYLQAGNLTAPDVLWQSSEPQAQPIWVEVNTHTHANWVFTAPGVYLVQVEASADLIDGRHVAEVATLRFAIGDAASADAARRAAFTQPVATVVPGAAADAGDGGGGGGALVAVVIAAAVALVAVVIVVVARGGSAKRRATAERIAAGSDGGPP